ncbi:enamine deaminase RidA (YjgF/YER057c/UK114 family) [Actinokineospora baliensis]|uniref:RidA family protein n=1 Tax=Actinokineospora baliensis TaxID=547056 RepID=UPI0027DAF6D2|nr:RidA family protein [Actinokineospora baliensis]MBM7774814.1 enamine deaminase RidA (YjgF/YER057c/UK114 family) [Actinokineospora baliensis]
MQHTDGVQHTNPAGLPRPNGYSHVVEVTGRLLYISGQVPLTADGTLAGTDIESQTRQVFRNIDTALASAGASMRQVAKLTYFITDTADVPAIRKVRDEFIDTAAPPASSLVQVVALVDPHFLVEIEAIAELP